MRKIIFKIGSESDPFDYLGDTDVLSHNSKSYNILTRFTADWISLVLIASVVAGMITIMYMLCKYMLVKKADPKAEIRSVITWKLGLIFLVESIGLILSTVTAVARLLV